MKILHTADIHIGYETHGRLDPETGLNTRLLDFKRCFDYMVSRALEEKIDLFLFCGDAYRTADPTPTQQKIFSSCLRPILDANIPVVIIIGNHDQPVSYGKASSVDIFGDLVGHVTVFHSVEKKVIETKSGPIQIVGLPWPIRSKVFAKGEHRNKKPSEVRALIEQGYIQYIDKVATSLSPTMPAVLAAHLTVHGADWGGSEYTSSLDPEPKFLVGDIAKPAFDYVALGHIHRFQDRNENAHPPVVYSSSIERINFKEAHDSKGFVFVTFEEKEGGGWETSYTFEPTPARRFVPIAVDVQNFEFPTEVILEAIEQHDISDAVVRVQYTIDESQLAKIDLSRIREALRDANVVASLDRKVEKSTRERNTVVTKDASTQEALEKYIAQHEKLHPIKEKLLQFAQNLEAEVRSS